jgi:hypothetical protein
MWVVSVRIVKTLKETTDLLSGPVPWGWKLNLVNNKSSFVTFEVGIDPHGSNPLGAHLGNLNFAQIPGRGVNTFWAKSQEHTLLSVLLKFILTSFSKISQGVIPLTPCPSFCASVELSCKQWDYEFLLFSWWVFCYIYQLGLSKI